MSNPPPTPLEEDSNSSWESDVFGSIATTLTQLTSWDQAVKELVQNADDAEATTIEFAIDDSGIIVVNNKNLTCCSNPRSKRKFCDFKSNSKNKLCDVHAIRTFSSQNKQDNSDATGKFGVGFASVFLFTDAPEMSSGNIRLRFDIENGEVPIDVLSEGFKGTRLKLPWATDPNSAIRVGLEKNAIEKSQHDGIVKEISNSIIRSLLFVKHLESASVIHNGSKKIKLERRKKDNEIQISDLLSGKTEKWILLESDESYESPLKELIPQHKAFSARKTKFEILIPREPKANFQGLVYATLATNQKTFLPFHLNASFFPDTSRNSISFQDRSNERDLKVLWNKTIIQQSALFISSALPDLQHVISNDSIWEIIRSAFSIHKKRTGELVPECFASFWTQIKQIASHLEIIEDQNGNYRRSTDVSLLIPSDKIHSSALSNLNISHQSKNETELIDIYKELGAREISQRVIAKSVLTLIQNSRLEDVLNDLEKISALYYLIEKLVQKDDSVDEELATLSIWKNSKDYFSQFSDLLLLPSDASLALAEELFPRLSFPSEKLKEYRSICSQIKVFSGDSLTYTLGQASSFISFIESNALKTRSVETFELVSKVLGNEPFASTSLEKLRLMGMWPHSDGQLSSLVDSVLPGSFEDPIGIGRLLAPEKLGTDMASILLNSFKIKELNINVYILQLLKSYSDSNEISKSHSKSLINQFARQMGALSSESIEALKDFEILFTSDGSAVKPRTTLYPTEKLLEFCSESDFDFLSLEFCESLNLKAEEFDTFLRKIGVTFDPTLSLLEDSWTRIQEDVVNRNDKVERLSKIANTIIELIQQAKKKPKTEGSEITRSDLRWPCVNGCTGWHSASEVIQSRWSKSICVTENLHAVSVGFAKQSSDHIYEVFKIKKYPPIDVAIRHLHHRVGEQIHPGDDFYKFLNWISKNGSNEEKYAIHDLRDESFIYNQSTFLKPRDVYTEVPEHLKFLSPYFHLVEKAPEGFESLWEVLEIGKLQESGTPYYLSLIKQDTLAGHFSEDIIERYKRAISVIGDAYLKSDLWAISYSHEFSNSSLLLNILNQWIQPSAAIIGDHVEWTETLAPYFGRNIVSLEPVAYEFAQQSGARKLSEELKVHEDSLEVSGPIEESLTRNFQDRFDAYFAFLANVIIDSENGGFGKFEELSQALSRLSELKIFAVPHIDVEISLEIENVETTEYVENAPSLYLREKNVVAFVRSEKDDLISVFSALIFDFIPTMTPGHARSFSATCSLLLSKPASEAINWLKKNDFLTHDVQLPTSSEVTYAKIDLKSDDRDGNSDFEDSDFEDQSPADEEEGEGELDIPEDHSAEAMDDVDKRVDISLDSESEKRKSFSGTDSRGSGKSEGAESFKKRQSSSNDQSDRKSQNQNFSAGDEGGSGNPNRTQKDFKEGIKNPKNHAKPSKRRRSGFAHAEAENGDGLGNVHNTKVEEQGIKWIIGKEWEIGRVVRNLNEDSKNNKGFDLISVSKSNPQDVRLIEVKSCAGYWPEMGVGLSRAQFEFAILEGFQSWLYVVENALGKDQDKRLHRIQDPWDKIRSVYFDPGWRDIAEVSIQQNPIQIVKGMRIKHDMYELGWISSDPTKQGHAIFFDVDFDNLEGTKKIRWDENVISVVDGEDDLS